ncbi:hypothetical protein Bbelb_013770 [Branchiostoma belcheri]|nr:hypothetical protein Bbelb_013770 [Branchiostoma belcheri]
MAPVGRRTASVVGGRAEFSQVLVRPHLEYSATVWDPYTTKGIQAVEAVQRRAARVTLNDYQRTSSVTQMLNDLQWPLLSERRRKARLTTFYKLTHNIIKIPTSNLLKPAQGLACALRVCQLSKCSCPDEMTCDDRGTRSIRLGETGLDQTRPGDLKTKDECQVAAADAVSNDRLGDLKTPEQACIGKMRAQEDQLTRRHGEEFVQLVTGPSETQTNSPGTWKSEEHWQVFQENGQEHRIADKSHNVKPWV